MGQNDGNCEFKGAVMPDLQSLTDRVHELNEARKAEDPRIQAMVADVRMIRTEIRGQAQCVNLALGNSRDAVEAANAVLAKMDVIDERLNRLEERIEAMAQWAKTKGKQ
jgi:hypothetical protein